MRRSKNSVGVESCNGALRLRLPRAIYGGRQKYLYLGLKDLPSNRPIAEAKAKRIESDILLNEFDSTLDKYQPKTFSPPSSPSQAGWTLITIWEAYERCKLPQLEKSSRRNFTTTRNHLYSIGIGDLERAGEIYQKLVEKYSSESARRSLMRIKAACNWAIDMKMIRENPFETFTIKGKKNWEIDPFSQQEKNAILEGFAQSEKYSFYLPFVRFLFLTGCRPSEAIALTWGKVHDHQIIFNAAYVEGTLKKTTKTNKPRYFPLNDGLRTLLAEIKPDNSDPNNLLFRGRRIRQILLHFHESHKNSRSL